MTQTNKPSGEGRVLYFAKSYGTQLLASALQPLLPMRPRGVEGSKVIGNQLPKSNERWPLPLFYLIEGPQPIQKDKSEQPFPPDIFSWLHPDDSPLLLSIKAYENNDQNEWNSFYKSLFDSPWWKKRDWNASSILKRCSEIPVSHLCTSTINHLQVFLSASFELEEDNEENRPFSVKSLPESLNKAAAALIERVDTSAKKPTLRSTREAASAFVQLVDQSIHSLFQSASQPDHPDSTEWMDSSEQVLKFLDKFLPEMAQMVMLHNRLLFARYCALTSLFTSVLPEDNEKGGAGARAVLSVAQKSKAAIISAFNSHWGFDFSLPATFQDANKAIQQLHRKVTDQLNSKKGDEEKLMALLNKLKWINERLIEAESDCRQRVLTGLNLFIQYLNDLSQRYRASGGLPGDHSVILAEFYKNLTLVSMPQAFAFGIANHCRASLAHCATGFLSKDLNDRLTCSREATEPVVRAWRWFLSTITAACDEQQFEEAAQLILEQTHTLSQFHLHFIVPALLQSVSLMLKGKALADLFETLSNVLPQNQLPQLSHLLGQSLNLLSPIEQKQIDALCGPSGSSAEKWWNSPYFLTTFSGLSRRRFLDVWESWVPLLLKLPTTETPSSPLLSTIIRHTGPTNSEQEILKLYFSQIEHSTLDEKIDLPFRFSRLTAALRFKEFRKGRPAALEPEFLALESLDRQLQDLLENCRFALDFMETHGSSVKALSFWFDKLNLFLRDLSLTYPPDTQQLLFQAQRFNGWANVLCLGLRLNVKSIHKTLSYMAEVLTGMPTVLQQFLNEVSVVVSQSPDTHDVVVKELEELAKHKNPLDTYFIGTLLQQLSGGDLRDIFTFNGTPYKVKNYPTIIIPLIQLASVVLHSEFWVVEDHRCQFNQNARQLIRRFFSQKKNSILRCVPSELKVQTEDVFSTFQQQSGPSLTDACSTLKKHAKKTLWTSELHNDIFFLSLTLIEAWAEALPSRDPALMSIADWAMMDHPRETKPDDVNFIPRSMDTLILTLMQMPLYSKKPCETILVILDTTNNLDIIRWVLSEMSSDENKLRFILRFSLCESIELKHLDLLSLLLEHFIDIDTNDLLSNKSLFAQNQDTAKALHSTLVRLWKRAEKLEKTELKKRLFTLIQSLFERGQLQPTLVFPFDTEKNKGGKPFRDWIKGWTAFTDLFRHSFTLPLKTIEKKSLELVSQAIENYPQFLDSFPLFHPKDSLLFIAVINEMREQLENQKKKTMIEQHFLTLVGQNFSRWLPKPITPAVIIENPLVKKYLLTRVDPQGIAEFESLFFTQVDRPLQLAFLALFERDPAPLHHLTLSRRGLAGDSEIDSSTKGRVLENLTLEAATDKKTLSSAYKNGTLHLLFDLSCELKHGAVKDLLKLQNLSQLIFDKARRFSRYHAHAVSMIALLNDRKMSALAAGELPESFNTALDDLPSDETSKLQEILKFIFAYKNHISEDKTMEKELLTQTSEPLIYTLVFELSATKKVSEESLAFLLPAISELPQEKNDRDLTACLSLLISTPFGQWPLYTFISFLIRHSDNESKKLAFLKQLQCFDSSVQKAPLTLFYYLLTLKLPLDFISKIPPSKSHLIELTELVYKDNEDLGLSLLQASKDIGVDDLGFVREILEKKNKEGDLLADSLFAVRLLHERTKGSEFNLNLTSHLSSMKQSDGSEILPDSRQWLPAAEQVFSLKEGPLSEHDLKAIAACKVSLFQWLDQYQREKSATNLRPIKQFFFTLIEHHRWLFGSISAAIIVLYHDTFFDIIHDSDELMMTWLIEDLLRQASENEDMPSATYHSLCEDEVFFRKLIDLIGQDSSPDVTLDNLPLTLQVEVIKQRPEILLTLKKSETLSPILKRLCIQGDSDALADIILELIPLIKPLLKTSLSSAGSVLNPDQLSTIETVSILNLLAERPDSLADVICFFLDDNDSSVKSIIQNTLGHPYFLAFVPDRMSVLQPIVKALSGLSDIEFEIEEAFLSLFRRESEDRKQRVSDDSPPSDVQYLVTHVLLTRESGLEFLELLDALISVDAVPRPFPASHQNTLTEAFVSPVQGERLFHLANERPSLFKAIILQPLITKAVMSAYKMEHLVLSMDLARGILRTIEQMSLNDIVSFLTHYISKDVFGDDVHKAFSEKCIELAQAFRLSFQETKLKVEADKEKIRKDLMAVLDDGFKMMKDADPFFSCAVDRLLGISEERIEETPAGALIRELEKPRVKPNKNTENFEGPNPVNITAFLTQITADSDLKFSFFTLILGKDPDWNSILSSNLIFGWQNQHSPMDILAQSLATPEEEHLRAQVLRALARNYITALKQADATITLNTWASFYEFLQAHLPHEMTEALTIGLGQLLLKRFTKSDLGLVQSLLQSSFLSNALKFQLLAPLLILKKGLYVLPLFSIFLRSALFLPFWNYFLSKTDEQELKSKFFIRNSSFDHLMFQYCRRALTEKPEQFFKLCQVGKDYLIVYFADLLFRAFNDYLAEAERLKEDPNETLGRSPKESILRLIFYSFRRNSYGFYNIISHFAALLSKAGNRNMGWFFGALTELGKSPPLIPSGIESNDDLQPLVLTLLQEAKYIDEESYITSTWFHDAPLTLDSLHLPIGPKDKQRLKTHIRETLNLTLQNRREFIEAIFTWGTRLLFDVEENIEDSSTGVIQQHQGTRNRYLFPYLLDTKHLKAKHQRLFDDFIKTMAGTHEGNALIISFLTTLTLKRLRSVLLAEERDPVIRELMIRILLKENILFKRNAGEKYRKKHMISTLIKEMLEELKLKAPERGLKLAFQEAFLLFFAASPQWINPIASPYSAIVIRTLDIDLAALNEGRARVREWISAQKDSSMSLTQIAAPCFNLLENGFQLIEVITITLSFEKEKPGIYKAFKQLLKLKIAAQSGGYLRRQGVDSPDLPLWRTAFFFTTMACGKQIGRITKNELNDVGKGELLYKELRRANLIDDFGKLQVQQVSSKSPLDFDSLFERSTKTGTSYALELKTNAQFYKKERDLFTQKLIDALKPKDQVRHLSESLSFLAFRRLSSDGVFVEGNWDDAWFLFGRFVEALDKKNPKSLSDISFAYIVHCLFADNSGIIKVNDRTMDFLKDRWGDDKNSVKAEAALRLLNQIFLMAHSSGAQWAQAFIDTFDDKAPWSAKDVEQLIDQNPDEGGLQQPMAIYIKRAVARELNQKLTTINYDSLHKLSDDIKSVFSKWQVQVEQLFTTYKSKTKNVTAQSALTKLMTKLEPLLQQENPFL